VAFFENPELPRKLQNWKQEKSRIAAKMGATEMDRHNFWKWIDNTN
jgi:hypothetical protein